MPKLSTSGEAGFKDGFARRAAVPAKVHNAAEYLNGYEIGCRYRESRVAATTQPNVGSLAASREWSESCRRCGWLHWFTRAEELQRQKSQPLAPRQCQKCGAQALMILPIADAKLTENDGRRQQRYATSV